VTSKRPDGFHNIETVMIPVQWNDIVEAVMDEKVSDETDFRSTGNRVYQSKEKNLCIRAYELLKHKYNLPPVKMHLHKIIPVGAGLGGGSSDAAHTLIAINKLFKLNISDEELETLSLELGSDCPFFIRNKPVLATGKGEVFDSVKIKMKNIFCVIVKPRIHISTSVAYSWVVPQERKIKLKELINAPLTEWKNTIENDFEKPVFERFPGIKNIKNRLYKLGATYASMTGSGSSVFGLFTEQKHVDTYFRSSTVWSGIIN
jgi:4-diphosphocytidyl-2-C-methyl-D-erythritol kinase